MYKREITLFGIGLLVGFFVLRTSKNKIIVAPKSKNTTNALLENASLVGTETTTATTQIQEPEVVKKMEDPKIEFCKEKWIKFAEKRKFSSAEQEQTTYNNFMTNCVVQS